jgi:hypothetical protein
VSAADSIESAAGTGSGERRSFWQAPLIYIPKPMEKQNSHVQVEALSCKILRLAPVVHGNTKILATFDLSVGDGLITIVDCRLVERHNVPGRTVYGPSVQRPATGTYPRFVRFESGFLEYITQLAESEYKKYRELPEEDVLDNRGCESKVPYSNAAAFLKA